MESLRMCCVCREMKNKNKLIRVCRNSKGEFNIDETQKAEGRGAYICKEGGCISKLKKNRGLNRAFKTQVPEEIYDKLSSLKEI